MTKNQSGSIQLQKVNGPLGWGLNTTGRQSNYHLTKTQRKWHVWVSSCRLNSPIQVSKRKRCTHSRALLITYERVLGASVRSWNGSRTYYRCSEATQGQAPHKWWVEKHDNKICKRLDFPILNVFVALQCTRLLPCIGIFIQPCHQVLSLRKLWSFAFITILKATQLFSLTSAVSCNRNWKSCHTDSINSVFLINIDISYLDFKAICIAILHHGI